MSSVRLRASGIEKRHGRVAALRGVDFEIEAGESVSILGANGAGKTSLLRILAGLSRPSGGRFEARAVAGHESSESPPLSRDALRSLVGYVAHATLLYGELTARENLAFAMRLQGRSPDRERIDRLLESLALGDVADRPAGGFSRGMAQRLSIARAVVHDPQLLLLDEPFTGLDETAAERLREQLRAQRAAGRTLVLITHDPRRAIELTDRALVLADGRLRAVLTRGARDAADPNTVETAAATFDEATLRAMLGALAREPAGPPHDTRGDAAGRDGTAP